MQYIDKTNRRFSTRVRKLLSLDKNFPHFQASASFRGMSNSWSVASFTNLNFAATKFQEKFKSIGGSLF